jgi:hypothetical protein
MLFGNVFLLELLLRRGSARTLAGVAEDLIKSVLIAWLLWVVGSVAMLIMVVLGSF